MKRLAHLACILTLTACGANHYHRDVAEPAQNKPSITHTVGNQRVSLDRSLTDAKEPVSTGTSIVLGILYATLVVFSDPVVSSSEPNNPLHVVP